MSAFKDFIQSKNPDCRKTLQEWWTMLQESHGDRAQLRRAKTAEEVLVSPAYQRTLIASLRRKNIHPNMSEQEHLALGAGILAHAKKLTQGSHIARRLGQLQILNDSIRDMRFRRLLAITDRDELYIGLLRMLKYLGNEVDPVSLVIGGYWWNETTKKEWARQYYVINNK